MWDGPPGNFPSVIDMPVGTFAEESPDADIIVVDVLDSGMPPLAISQTD